MPRANRIQLPGHVWHITHRCHDRAFLLEDQTDRSNWRRWLAEATVRHGLRVLDYIATSNHVHLLVFDATGDESIARALQLVQGRTAQDYNRRHGRRGAFWQDRYHAVAVDSERYLWACLVYIDLNMVRAGVVAHPRDWACCGYNDLQHPRSRDQVVELELLAEMTGCASVRALQTAHRELVETALRDGSHARDTRWTEAIAVGKDEFVNSVRSRLGLSKLQRVARADDGAAVLREVRAQYVTRDSCDLPWDD